MLEAAPLLAERASDVLECLPSLPCQLRVLAALVVGLALALFLGGATVRRLLHDHPAKPRVVARMQHDLNKDFQCADMSDDQVWRLFCELFIIGLQHLAGGVLILPALLGVGDPGVAHKLAMVGALSELSYDVWDSARSLYRHCVANSLPGGRRALIFVLLHHQMSLALVLPMNTHYSHSRLYLHMVFNLMGAGGFALFVSHAGQMLDLRTRRDLLVMRGLATAQFAVMLYTRVLAFFPLAACLLHTAYRDGSWLILGVGAPALGFMAFFNALILPSAYRRMRKFYAMSVGDPEEHQRIPEKAKQLEPEAEPEEPEARCQDLARTGESALSDAGTMQVAFLGSKSAAPALGPEHPASAPPPAAADAGAAGRAKRTAARFRSSPAAKAAAFARGIAAGLRRRRAQAGAQETGPSAAA